MAHEGDEPNAYDVYGLTLAHKSLLTRLVRDTKKRDDLPPYTERELRGKLHRARETARTWRRNSNLTTT